MPAESIDKLHKSINKFAKSIDKFAQPKDKSGVTFIKTLAAVAFQRAG